MSQLRKIMNHCSRTEFMRYFWAGSLTFATDFTILFSLTELAGVNYLWSNLAGVSIGIILSYLLCIKWVFVDRRYNQITLEFPLFILTCIVGVVLNEFCLWLFVEYIDLHYLAAKLVVTALVFVLNFLMKKMILFRKL